MGYSPWGHKELDFQFRGVWAEGRDCVHNSTLGWMVILQLVNSGLVGIVLVVLSPVNQGFPGLRW